MIRLPHIHMIPHITGKISDPRFKETIVYNGAEWGIGNNGPQPGRIEFTYVGGEQNSPTITGFYAKKAVDSTQNSIEAFNSSTDWVELQVC